MTGYSDRELHDIQQRWKITFPPDVLAIYRRRRSVLPKDDFDWVKTPKAEIAEMLDWPLEGILFDVAESDFWLPEWGRKPASKSAFEQFVRATVAAAPRLIPVHGHRYIPETPHASGNPVLSVHQTDIIHYGANLDDYVEREWRHKNGDWPRIRTIPFWSRLIEFNASGQ